MEERKKGGHRTASIQVRKPTVRPRCLITTFKKNFAMRHKRLPESSWLESVSHFLHLCQRWPLKKISHTSGDKVHLAD